MLLFNLPNRSQLLPALLMSLSFRTLPFHLPNVLQYPRLVADYNLHNGEPVA
jgi:hypothetical protein